VPTEILKNSVPQAAHEPSPNRPRVLHLVESFDQGGSELQALQLVQSLCRDARYDVRLASIKPAGVLRPQAESLGLPEIPSYPLTSFYDGRLLRQLRQFAARLREWRIDILHTHDFYTNVFGMAAGALARVPARIASRRDLGAMRNKAQSMLEGIAFRMAHRIVVNSEAVRGALLGHGVPAGKITIIPNGVDEKRIATPLERREALNELQLSAIGQRQVVTIVANFRLAIKDHATFLRCAQRVRAELPDTMFVLAGEGELKPEMEAMAEQVGLRDHAIFTGRCGRLAELLAISDVCVSSSTSEGFSGAILEYMAAGRPVVATDVGGAREAVVEADTGYLVAVRDDATMASRVVKLLQEPGTAAAFGQRGRERAKREFSTEQQLKRTLELYAQLVVDSRR